MTDPHYPDSFAPLLNLDGIGPRMAERYREIAERVRLELHMWGHVSALAYAAELLIDGSTDRQPEPNTERVFAPLLVWLAGEVGRE